MNEAATSLDRLHDIVLPPEVSWWPPAPGWYVVGGILLLLVIVLIYRARKRWLANAYRRAALHELASVHDAAGIAELLRRTALVNVSRSVIAAKTGAAWLDWLDSQCRETMPETVREQLTAGVYRHHATPDELRALRDYAAHWITRHQVTGHQILSSNGVSETGMKSELH
jgi:hypothetical protein